MSDPNAPWIQDEVPDAPVVPDELEPERGPGPHGDLDADLDAVDDVSAAEVVRAAASDPDGPAPRVVAFDIGEVLIDETRVWATWAELLGVSPLTFGAVLGAAIVQGGDHEVALPHVAPNVEWQEFVDEHERRYGGIQEQDLYPDVRACLQELRELGFRIVVAGNQPARRHDQLQSLELPLDALAMSDALGVEKPDPAFFDAVCELAEVTDPGEVLYVGDRVDNDVLPAAEAGMRTCWLRRGPWGLLQDMPDDAEADLVLDGLGELPLLLGQWAGS